MPRAAGNVEIVCRKCGKVFTTWASNHRVYCSRECSPTDNARRHGQSKTRLHTIWCGMNTRCLCPTSQAYSYYGGRGITVCDEWAGSFEAFRDWSLSNGYDESLSLDRRDTNGNYDPGNCRWATRTQQMRNTRKRINAKTSRFKGVSWCANAGKWRAQLHAPGRSAHIGLFAFEDDAAKAYDAKAREVFGEFSRTNF